MTHLSPELGHADAATCRAPSGGTPPLAVFDLGVLQALIGDEPAIVHEFLADFLAAARRQRGAMRDAEATRAFGEVRVLAHNLKSSSRSVGAHRLGEACQSLERAATAVDVVAVAAWLQALEAELALAEAEIIAALEALGGEPQGEMA